MAGAAGPNLASVRFNARNRVSCAVASGAEVGGLSPVILGTGEVLQDFFFLVDIAQHNKYLLSLGWFIFRSLAEYHIYCHNTGTEKAAEPVSRLRCGWFSGFG